MKIDMAGYGNYNYVIDSTFRPFSMQEMLTPLTLYKDAYEKTEEAYAELADKFTHLKNKVQDDPEAKALYEGYAQELEKQAADLSRHGLSMGNRAALTNLRRRYKGEIGSLLEAEENMKKLNDARLQMNLKDPSMIYASENLKLSDFLPGKNPNIYGVSGSELYKAGAQAAASLSSKVYGDTQVNPVVNLSNAYQELITTQGYSPEALVIFMQNADSIPELKQAVDDILATYGATKNLTGASYRQARQSVLSGILHGAGYKESRSYQQNPDVLTAAQREQFAVQRENRNWDRRSSGFDENGIYHPELDEQGRAQAARAGAVAQARGTVDENGNPISRRQESQEGEYLKEAQRYSKGKVFSIPSNKTERGKEISFAEACNIDPAVAQHHPGYEDCYYYYQHSDGSVIILPKSSKVKRRGSNSNSASQVNAGGEDQDQI